ncbi:UNKNOWN [Stylonychia lemnae]|uniref:Uncharacterized protein n=1 Tax=Stylonychia lemnae TaxID=5949 RepID=A0A078BA34_STYLE|nr:UNKNOWN [Stylonychia lemnae]|eukprot:CDW91284.1 UNKNOWN [Stylonychia lemnae]
MQIISYILCIINIAIPLNYLAVIYSQADKNLRINSNIERYFSPIYNLGSFFAVFQTQIYFMYYLQSVGRRKTEIKAFKVTIISTSAILLYSIYYGGIMFMLYQTEDKNQEPTGFSVSDLQTFFFKVKPGYSLLALTILQQILIFPFYFFMAKEYTFVLYDELKNRSLSKKIEQLKMMSSMKDVYTELMLKIEICGFIMVWFRISFDTQFNG